MQAPLPHDSSPHCASAPLLIDQWVPPVERPVVPQHLAQLCSPCPLRQQCLTQALRDQESGYWAGTTSRDRTTMRELDQGSVSTAEWLQELKRQEYAAGPATHSPGGGSAHLYRQGCRCAECRQEHATARARERARHRSRAAAQ